eukprot:3786925-Rhodomonas_salina.3
MSLHRRHHERSLLLGSSHRGVSSSLSRVHTLPGRVTNAPQTAPKRSPKLRKQRQNGQLPAKLTDLTETGLRHCEYSMTESKLEESRL